MSAIDQTLQFVAGRTSGGQPAGSRYASSLYSSRGTGVGQAELYHSALLQTMRGTGPQTRAERLAERPSADRPLAGESRSSSPAGSTPAEVSELRQQPLSDIRNRESRPEEKTGPATEPGTLSSLAPASTDAGRSTPATRPVPGEPSNEESPAPSTTAAEGSPPALLAPQPGPAPASQEEPFAAEQPALEQLFGEIATDQAAAVQGQGLDSTETGTTGGEAAPETAEPTATPVQESPPHTAADPDPAGITSAEGRQLAEARVEDAGTPNSPTDSGTVETASGKAGTGSVSGAGSVDKVEIDSQPANERATATDTPASTAGVSSELSDAEPAQSAASTENSAEASAVAVGNTRTSSASVDRGQRSRPAEGGRLTGRHSRQHDGDAESGSQPASGTVASGQPASAQNPRTAFAGQQDSSDSGTQFFGGQSSGHPAPDAATSGSSVPAIETSAAPPPADAGPQPAVAQQAGPGVPVTESAAPATSGDAAATRAAERLVERVTSAMRQLRPGGGQLRILLQPVELGELRIELQQRADGVTARMEVTTPEAQQMLADRLPRLRESLASRGIVLDSVQIELSPRQSSREQQRSDQQRHGQDQQGGREHRQQQGRRGRQQSSGQHESADQGGSSTQQ